MFSGTAVRENQQVMLANLFPSRKPSVLEKKNMLANLTATTGRTPVLLPIFTVGHHKLAGMICYQVELSMNPTN